MKKNNTSNKQTNKSNNTQKKLDLRTLADLLGAAATFFAACLSLAFGVTSDIILINYARLAFAAILGLLAGVMLLLSFRYVKTQWKPSPRQKAWFRNLAIFTVVFALGVVIQARFLLLPPRTRETPTPTLAPPSPTATVTPLLPTFTPTLALPSPTPTVLKKQLLTEDVAVSLRSIVPDGNFFFTLYFDITNNSNKPFTVRYKDTDIQVEDNLGEKYSPIFAEEKSHSIDIGIGEVRTINAIFKGPIDSKVSLLDVTAMLMLNSRNEAKKLHWIIPLQWEPRGLVELTLRKKVVGVLDTDQTEKNYLILYFDITNNSDKPFIVRYKDSDIRVQDNQGTAYELAGTKWMQIKMTGEFTDKNYHPQVLFYGKQAEKYLLRFLQQIYIQPAHAEQKMM